MELSWLQHVWMATEWRDRACFFAPTECGRQMLRNVSVKFRFLPMELIGNHFDCHSAPCSDQTPVANGQYIYSQSVIQTTASNESWHQDSSSLYTICAMYYLLGTCNNSVCVDGAWSSQGCQCLGLTHHLKMVLKLMSQLIWCPALSSLSWQSSFTTRREYRLFSYVSQHQDS